MFTANLIQKTSKYKNKHTESQFAHCHKIKGFLGVLVLNTVK